MQDIDLLQGSWSIETISMDGQSLAADLSKARLVITGMRFESIGMGAVYEGTLELDPTANPRQHDRFTVADRKFEERVLSLVLESPKTRHFLYANRVDRVSPVHETKR